VNPIVASPAPQDGLRLLERAQVAVARLRGWSRYGAHEQAAKALDAAIAAVDAADAALRAFPYATTALATLHADLDRATGGT